MNSVELRNHPEYPYVTWDLKPDRHGKVEVAKGRGGPINISWQVHGHGPRHIVFIMGLGALKTAWQRQTKDFGHTDRDKYSCLILDNRGIGESDKPFTRYSTSEMAKDMIELLDHVGWTAERELNVIGISMGGMIAQELAMLIPNRIASLTFVSTAARLVNTVGFVENMRNRVNLFIPKSVDKQIEGAKHNMYTESYLASPDTTEYTISSFPTAGDRFAASELQKRSDPTAFTRKGFISQALAAGWHHKTAAQIKQIADQVGRERICVMHGTADRMITFPHGETLLKELNDGSNVQVRKAFWEDVGHVIPLEKREEFKKIIGELIDKARGLKSN